MPILRYCRNSRASPENHREFRRDTFLALFLFFVLLSCVVACVFQLATFGSGVTVQFSRFPSYDDWLIFLNFISFQFPLFCFSFWFYHFVFSILSPSFHYPPPLCFIYIIGCSYLSPFLILLSYFRRLFFSFYFSSGLFPSLVVSLFFFLSLSFLCFSSSPSSEFLIR